MELHHGLLSRVPDPCSAGAFSPATDAALKGPRYIERKPL